MMSVMGGTLERDDGSSRYQPRRRHQQAMGGPGKQPTPSRLLELSNALTDRARCEREFMRGLLHFSGACHCDKGLQQREASDHGASLAQLNLVTKSLRALGSSLRN